MAESGDLEFARLPGAAPAEHAQVDAAGWRAVCGRVAAEGGRLVALWGSDGTQSRGGVLAVHAALAASGGLLLVTLPVPERAYPDVSDLFPAANRMQRAVFDLLGVSASGAPDHRPWLRHGAWPPDVFPLRKSGRDDTVFDNVGDAYPFVHVAGDGVHEIAVGPVHAGTIEPGHFRFSVIGERVLRLEERLGYAHKGIERRFEQLDLMEGARLAGRVSCDSTVAYAWAYAMAVESACGIEPTPRAAWLRALCLERERIANHLGDLGFLGNDAGLAFGLAQFSRLKEDVLRANHAMFAHRYLMDAIVPGGTAVNVAPDVVQRFVGHAGQLAHDVCALRQIYEEHDGLRDRFATTGSVSPTLATWLGIIGLAGRASGQAHDARVDWPTPPYDDVTPAIVVRSYGDVAARIAVRFDEVLESCRLVARLAGGLPEGPSRAEVALPTAPAFGLGVVEAWRGPVLVALDAGPGNRVLRCHPHDPSWQNWPALEHAVIGNIVPDFPLINKSFNLSYSGHDL